MHEPTRGKDGVLHGYTEARVHTPPLQQLWPRTPERELLTDGYQVIDFAEHVLGLPLLPWQQWLAVHALELLPNGKRRFRTVVAEVARQNGKTHFSSVLALWILYMKPGHKVLGTSATHTTAEKQWQEAWDLAKDIDDLSDEISETSNTNGNKSVTLANRSQYLVRATNRKATRGYSIDLVLLDELREADWEGWGAATKTTLARPGAQTWCLSNAGDDKSVVLKRLRQVSHEKLGDPDGIISAMNDGLDVAEAEGAEVPEDDSIGWYEWSADPRTPATDRDSWARANPGLGTTIEEAAIAGAFATDEPHVFDTECRCVWVEVAGVSQFPKGTWEAGFDDKSCISDDSELAWAIDLSSDRTTTHVAVAGWRDDGQVHIEIVASRAGVDWLSGWFSKRTGTYGKMSVALQGRGAPVSSQAEVLEDIPGVEVVPWQSVDLPQGHGLFYDAVVRGEVFHGDQQALDRAAAQTVIKVLGGSEWVWDRLKSPVDAAPLVAATGAWWNLTRKKEAPARSMYEDSGLLVV